MQYPDAIRRLYGLRSRGVKLGLGRVEAAVKLRGNPEREMGRVVHVAGTNGKGSTAAMAASVCHAAGLRTGFFSSPHLHRFGERIRIDGRPLDDDELAPRLTSIFASLDEPSFPELSFFEVATLLAFEAFRDAGTDVVVLETGLGGRLDATNVAQADVAVITRIARDHEHLLGEGLGAVAVEKAGIIEPNKPFICAGQDPTALEVLEAVARGRGAPMSLFGRDFHIRPSSDGNRTLVDVVVGSEVIRGLTLGLEGAHQVDNAAAAVAAIVALRGTGVDIGDDAVRRGLAEARWPGRLERIDAMPTVIFDVAHNPDACIALASYLATRPPKTRALVFGAMRDKDHDAMIRPLEGLFPHRFWTRPRIDRAEEPAHFASLSYGEVVRDVVRALHRAQAIVGPDGEVVVAGSVFVVAEARAALLDLPAEEAIGL
ncbi:MAG: bifunctional folylpolyglutamate synthase/dihydrofolate synthase [Deltaproteobacteria bacterium]|nr:bifunctional folylpolyglutamate synthase/dihydrofolate synthase [Deltaproteobacteria bacterium]